MNVHKAYDELLDVISDSPDEVKVDKEQYNGNPLWCIRWSTNGSWSKSRICLASGVNNPPHSTLGSAFNEWFSKKCHYKITCTDELPGVLEDWIKRIQE